MDFAKKLKEIRNMDKFHGTIPKKIWKETRETRTPERLSRKSETFQKKVRLSRKSETLQKKVRLYRKADVGDNIWKIHEEMKKKPLPLGLHRKPPCITDMKKS